MARRTQEKDVIEEFFGKSNQQIISEGLLRILDGEDHAVKYSLMVAAEKATTRSDYPFVQAAAMFPLIGDEDSPEAVYGPKNKSRTIDPEHLALFKKHLKDSIASAKKQNYENPDLVNFLSLARLVGASDSEIQFLALLFAIEHHQHWQIFNKEIPYIAELPYNRFLMSMLTQEARDAKPLSHEGILASSGLITVSGRGARTDDDGQEIAAPFLNPLMVAPLSGARMSLEEIKEAFLGSPQTTQFTIDDFIFLRDAGHDPVAIAEYLKGLNADGLTNRRPHLFFFGPPGVGKSQFALAVAATADSKVYAVGEKKPDGSSYTGAERLQLLHLLRIICADDPDIVLLFDEAEGATANEKEGRTEAETSSRITLHRILEESKGPPVIWITNEQFNRGLLRRFGEIVEFDDEISATFLKKVWRRLADQYSIPLSKENIDALVGQYPQALPGHVTVALNKIQTRFGPQHVAELFTFAALETALKNSLITIDGTARPYHPTVKHAPLPLACYQATHYDHGTLGESIDTYCHLVSSNKKPRMLIAGDAGCGQEQLARLIEQKTGKKILLLPTSAIGKPEHIDAALDQASDRGYILVVDDRGMTSSALFGEHQSPMRSELEKRLRLSQVPCLLLSDQPVDPTAHDYKIDLARPRETEIQAIMQKLYGITITTAQAGGCVGLTIDDFLRINRQIIFEDALDGVEQGAIWETIQQRHISATRGKQRTLGFIHAPEVS